MTDTDLVLSVNLNLDSSDPAEHARQIGDAWHEFAETLEAVEDE